MEGVEYGVSYALGGHFYPIVEDIPFPNKGDVDIRYILSIYY